MDQQLQQLPGVLLGEITGVAADGRPVVRVGPHGVARPAIIACLAAPPDWGTLVGMKCACAFVDGDQDQPLVLGVLGGVPASIRVPRTLHVAAGEQLTIECGKSKIHLRADGRIEIRGEHLVSRSSGPNKVKGGSVHIN